MRRIAAVLFALAVALTACSKEEKSNATTDTASIDAAPPATREVMNLVASPTSAPKPAATPAPSPRMIVRKASLSLVVRDSLASMRAISAEAARSGGYVTESKQWRENDQLRGSITIRVPAERFDETLGSAKKGAVRVVSENVSGDDVTQEFSDLAARLRNAEAAETELRQLLTVVRERMKKAEDILEVYAKLSEVRGEIEQLKGRMQYLSQVTALATITIELIPDVLARPVVEPAWRPLAVVHTATHALVATLKWLATLAIWLAIYVVPLALLITAVVWPLRRWRGALTKPL